MQNNAGDTDKVTRIVVGIARMIWTVAGGPA